MRNKMCRGDARVKSVIIAMTSVCAIAIASCQTSRQEEPVGVRKTIKSAYNHTLGHTFEKYGASASRAKYLNLFDTELRALIESDLKIAERDEHNPNLDADPFCGCQDTLGFSYRVLSIRKDGGEAVGTVENRYGHSRRETFTYRFRYEDGEWRVADISQPGEPSLKAWLREELQKPW